MARPALSQEEFDRFRDDLCAVAARRFAEHGYRGVTLRAVAAELGCSPMTPYRYFANKAAIFDAVRIAAFERFAAAQQAAAEAHSEPLVRLRALCEAYVGFALEDPHAYRIMFELEPPEACDPPRPEEGRAWTVMRSCVGEAVEAGMLEGDAEVLAHLLWSSVHGLVALHLAGKLVLGQRLEDLVGPFMDRAIGRAHHTEETNP